MAARYLHSRFLEDKRLLGLDDRCLTIKGIEAGWKAAAKALGRDQASDGQRQSLSAAKGRLDEWVKLGRKPFADAPRKARAPRKPRVKQPALARPAAVPALFIPPQLPVIASAKPAAVPALPAVQQVPVIVTARLAAAPALSAPPRLLMIAMARPAAVRALPAPARPLMIASARPAAVRALPAPPRLLMIAMAKPAVVPAMPFEMEVPVAVAAMPAVPPADVRMIELIMAVEASRRTASPTVETTADDSFIVIPPGNRRTYFIPTLVPVVPAGVNALIDDGLTALTMRMVKPSVPAAKSKAPGRRRGGGALASVDMPLRVAVGFCLAWGFYNSVSVGVQKAIETVSGTTIAYQKAKESRPVRQF